MEKTKGYLAAQEWVAEKKLKEGSSLLPSVGTYYVNGLFALAINERYPDKVFVVYRRIKYKNVSIAEDRMICVAFDKTSGNEIVNFCNSKECYNGFYKDCIEIE